MTKTAISALHRPHRLLVALGLVGLGAMATGAALAVNENRSEHEARARSERVAASTAAAMSADFERTEEIASALAGFVTSSESVEGPEFDRFVGRFLEDRPEIRSMELLDFLTDDERPDLETRMANSGVSTITVRGEDGSLIEAPPSDEYLVTWFESSKDPGVPARGLNVLGATGDAHLIDEMVAGGSKGVAVAQLDGPSGTDDGTLTILTPVFDTDLPLTTAQDRADALVGAASVTVSYAELFEETTRPAAATTNLVLGTSGSGADSLASRVHGEIGSGPTSDDLDSAVPGSTASEPVTVANRELVLSAAPRQSLPGMLAAPTRRSILIVGALFTCLMVGGYLWWSRVRRLERLARALEEANARLESNAAKMQHLAEFDQLTGLPNRQSMHRRLEELIGDAAVAELSVILVDLDRFKEINDSIGHHRGDELLRLVAERLAGCVRSGTLGRRDGDEFCVLLAGVAPDGASAVADRLVATLHRPFRVGDRSVSLTATLAICSSPAHASSAVGVMERADVALHSQKARSRDTWVAYDESMAAAQERRSSIATELRYALEGNGMPVLTYFQPKVDLATGRIVSAESLARWRHPQFGEVSPSEFIDVASETGLIVALDEERIVRTIDMLRRCDQRNIDVESISVNVSAQQFSDERFVQRLRGHLRDAEVAAASLVLEITESEAMEQADYGAIMERMSELAAMGVGLSIDDFGTGYSSMSRIGRLPVHEVKVDQSFVEGLPDSRVAVGIIRAVISMAHTLGMRVVAEGVETSRQRDWLITEGCDQAQGWLYARALDPEGFLDAIASQQVDGPLPMSEITTN